MRWQRHVLCCWPDHLWWPVLLRDLQWQRLLPTGINSVWRQLLQHRQLPQRPMRFPWVLPMWRYSVSARQYLLREHLLCWGPELHERAVLHARGVGVWGWGLWWGLGRQPMGGEHLGGWRCTAGMGRAVLGVRVLSCTLLTHHDVVAAVV